MPAASFVVENVNLRKCGVNLEAGKRVAQKNVGG